MDRKYWTLFLSTMAIGLLVQETSADVKAKMKYHLVDGTRPYFYGYRREGIKEGEIDAGGATMDKEVVFMNGRKHELYLDANSFELTKCETSLSNSDFYEEDKQKITTVYYKEMADCVKEKLGAGHVKVFHHQVRNKKRSTGKPNIINTNIQGYAHGVHSDTHPESADGAFAFIAMGEGQEYSQGRYLYLNLWRSIDDENPIMGDHLAMVDQTSLTHGVGSEDYVESDFYGEDAMSGFRFALKQFRLNEKNSDAHRWFYFPNMTKSEVILFKQWDSDPEKETNLCFHSAFEDPTTPPDAPTRQSIEVRMMVLFPDHTPNTCPSKWKIFLYMIITLMASISMKYPLASSLLGLGSALVISYVLYCCCRKKAMQDQKKNE